MKFKEGDRVVARHEGKTIRGKVGYANNRVMFICEDNDLSVHATGPIPISACKRLKPPTYNVFYTDFCTVRVVKLADKQSMDKFVEDFSAKYKNNEDFEILAIVKGHILSSEFPID